MPAGMYSVPLAERPIDRYDRAFLGHPVGLGYLAFTEGWERFSSYGMQTLLVLYMTRQLLLPGHVERIAGFTGFRAAVEALYGHPLSTLALASAIFGLYTGLVYLAPIGGGWLADRWLGRTRTVTIGALLMSAGHFFMAFDVSFLPALSCLLIGTGCFKGNLASQVGALYAPHDLRRADAYQIYYLFISGAVIVAPLVTGTLGEGYGWHYGFGAAGVGMLIGLAVYLTGRRWLPRDAPAAASAAGSGGRGPARLTRDERAVVIVLILLLPVLTIGTVGNQQIFNAYLLWVPDHVDLVFFGHRMPTTWLITVDATVSILSLMGVMAFWRWWSRSRPEPSEIDKITLGFVSCVAAQLCLTAAAAVSSDGHRAGLGWLLGFELLNSLGFANVLPVGLALFTRAAPRSLSGMMVGIYFLHLFAANNLVGWLGGLLERLPGTQFWGLHAALAAIAALLTFIAARAFRRLLAPGEQAARAHARSSL